MLHLVASPRRCLLLLGGVLLGAGCTPTRNSADGIRHGDPQEGGSREAGSREAGLREAGLREAGPAPSPAAGYFDGTSRIDHLPQIDCGVTVTRAEIAPAIATVGIVEFSSTFPDVVAAEIHFGRGSEYGLVAPVDLTEEAHRTLLLGMTQDSTYHFRVALSDGASVCYGSDHTLETGSLGSVPLAEAWTSDGAAPGFIVTARDNQAVIYDKQGELVWAYDLFNVFSVQLSWDAQYLMGRDPGPFDLGSGGTFYRVRMDGSEFVAVDAPGGDHHDFAAIPDGIAYLAKTREGECDRVFEASLAITDGAPIFDTWPIFRYFPETGAREGTEICHANRVHYLADVDVYTVSDRNKDVIAVFGSGGAPVLSIGKAPVGTWSKHVQADGAGPGGDWHIQHGHHFYADDQLVVFSNDSNGGAAVLHYTLLGDRARLDWKYDGAGASMIQGDVQRLPNGNFLVTANLSGTIVELGPDGQTELGRYELGGPTGPLYGFTYSRHRASLYGEPAPR